MMIYARFILSAFFVSAAVSFAAAAEILRPQDLPLIAEGLVTHINDHNTLTLDSGKTYRLSNIYVPKAAETRLQEWLQTNVLSRKVFIYTKDRDAQDRFGNVRAHIVLADGAWAQEQLILNGLALTYSTPSEKTLIQPLYAAEDKARIAKKGLWKNEVVKNDQTIRSAIGSFQIYEGMIKSVASKDRYIYFNFGDDYKTDFTIVLKRSSLPLFRSEPEHPFSPEIWNQRYVRIRGWVENRNGPMIVLTHPEQIEFPKIN